jgi:hypothetical protein
MTWQDLAANLGTKTLVGEFKAIEPQVSKRQYKRLLSTALAQLLELDPDTKSGKARRWARRATGVKPSRKALKAADRNGALRDAEMADEAEAGGAKTTSD